MMNDVEKTNSITRNESTSGVLLLYFLPQAPRIPIDAAY